MLNCFVKKYCKDEIYLLWIRFQLMHIRIQRFWITFDMHLHKLGEIGMSYLFIYF